MQKLRYDLRFQTITDIVHNSILVPSNFDLHESAPLRPTAPFIILYNWVDIKKIKHIQNGIA